MALRLFEHNEKAYHAAVRMMEQYGKAAYMILDEFHRAGAECWGKSAVALLKLCPDAKLLGLTATNIRYLDNNRDMAEELFDSRVASNMTLGEAVVRGILPAPKYVTTVYQYQKTLAKYQARVDNLRAPGIQDVNQKYLDALRRALEQANGLDRVFAHHITNLLRRARRLEYPETVYITPGGLSLGVWLVTQRRVREGQIQGNLTEQQIARLDSIGMVWGNRKEIAWQHGFEVAKKYHDTYGNLMVPGKYTDPDGYPLGQWIIKTRQQKLNGRLKEERIAQLDEIGMVWNIFDAKWEKAYALAAAYYEENGNLNIPRSYVTAAGERLGQWVASQQWAYPKGKLTDEQIERLNRIGMYWGNRNDRQWNEGYQEATRYFEAHGDLNVPADYVSPGGYNLGNWVKRQRYARLNPEKSCAVLTEERIAKLDAIGMRWEKSNLNHLSQRAVRAETVTAKAG